MGFWSRLENIENAMKKWHNRLYKWACIGMFILITNMSAVAMIGWTQYRLTVLHVEPVNPILAVSLDLTVYVGVPVLFGFLAYTMLFTTFQFPIRFRGGGHGKTIDPPSQ